MKEFNVIQAPHNISNMCSYQFNNVSPFVFANVIFLAFSGKQYNEVSLSIIYLYFFDGLSKFK